MDKVDLMYEGWIGRLSRSQTSFRPHPRDSTTATGCEDLVPGAVELESDKINIAVCCPFRERGRVVVVTLLHSNFWLLGGELINTN